MRRWCMESGSRMGFLHNNDWSSMHLDSALIDELCRLILIWCTCSTRRDALALVPSCLPAFLPSFLPSFLLWLMLFRGFKLGTSRALEQSVHVCRFFAYGIPSQKLTGPATRRPFKRPLGQGPIKGGYSLTAHAVVQNVPAGSVYLNCGGGPAAEPCRVDLDLGDPEIFPGCSHEV
jgi:hypothetical protein